MGNVSSRVSEKEKGKCGIIKVFHFLVLLYRLRSAVHDESAMTDSCLCTHNATLRDITGGNLSDYMQLPPEPKKAFPLYFFFPIYTHTVVQHEACEHTSICKIGGVTL